MAIAGPRPRQATVLRRLWRPALIGYAALAALVAWWTWRALSDPLPWDTGLAYQAGQLAWATGHPEHLATWNGTPLLVAVMALLSRVVTARGAADLVTALNVATAVGAVALVLRRSRGVLPARWRWIAALGLISFAPLISSVWFKQFNVIVLVLALAGFELMRRGQVPTGAGLIGLSVALKPLAILLPLILLARRDTRRAGAFALAWIAGLSLAAQALLAARAHDLGPLDPLTAIRNFLEKTKPVGVNFFFLCHPANYSPQSLLCRVVGVHHWSFQRVAVGVFLLLLGAWVIDALRGRAAMSWEVFAFGCALSVMLSPIAWSHYQVMLAPLFFLLFLRFVRDGATVGAWAGLILALVLASLIWQPYGSIVNALATVWQTAPRPREPTFLEGFSQFAQYLVVLTGVFWYVRHRAAAGQPGKSTPSSTGGVPRLPGS